jgi:hypothetical protein
MLLENLSAQPFVLFSDELTRGLNQKKIIKDAAKFFAASE